MYNNYSGLGLLEPGGEACSENTTGRNSGGFMETISTGKFIIISSYFEYTNWSTNVKKTFLVISIL